jgi:Zn-dependent protease with chaperone function
MGNMRHSHLWLFLAALISIRASASDQIASQPPEFTTSEIQADAEQRYQSIIADLAQHSNLDKDSSLLTRSRHIMESLVATATVVKPESATWQWELHVADSPAYDALCMAGGKVLLGSQFVNQMQLTDDELAMVLAHEVAHALLEHQGEELSHARSLLPGKFPRVVRDVQFAIGFDYGLQLKLSALSRQQELEADWFGMILASRAGWNASTLVSFFKKLANTEESGFNDMTHPSATVRLVYAKATAAALEKNMNPAPVR